MGSKFTMNIGPGTVIGAMAVGPGAQAEGSIGGSRAPDSPKVRATFEVKGASSGQAAAWLRMLATSIELGQRPSFAKTEAGASVAWAWESDK